MADISQLQSLPQQFPWEDIPLQNELRRLMSTLEPRFINLENQTIDWEAAVENITALGIDRVNEVLGPLLEQLDEAAQLGFLIAYAEDFENTMEEGEPFGIVITSAGKELFTPTPQLTIMDTDNEENWGTATLQSYDKETGDLTVTISFVNSPATAGENWVVACGSGILPKTIEASDAAVTARNEVEVLADQFADDLVALQVLLESLETGAVVSVNGQTGIVTLTFNISDITGLQAALDAKATTSALNTGLSGKQSASAKLTALSDETWSADNLFMMTGSSTLDPLPISTFTKGLLDEIDATAWRTALGVVGTTFATDAEIRSSTGTGAIKSESLASASVFVGLTDATTVALNWASGINFEVTLTASRVLGNPTNGVPGTTRTVLVKGNSTTDRTLTFGNQYLGTVPSIIDIDSGRWYRLSIFCITSSHFNVTSVKALG